MKKGWVFAAVIVLLVCGCRKHNLPSPAFRTSLLLVKMTWSSGNSAEGQTLLFTYNSDNLVSMITRIQAGSDPVNGVPPWSDTAHGYFEYSNGRMSRYTDVSNPVGYYKYEYDDNGRVTKRIFHDADDVFSTTCSYSYDTAGNLIAMVDSTPGHITFRYNLEYDADHNVISATNYWRIQSHEIKEKYEWSGFDDKINFIAAIHGLPVTFEWDDNFLTYSTSTPHNYSVEKFYFPVQSDFVYEDIGTTQYSYTYNNEGLPVKIMKGPATITLEYK